MGSIKFSKLGIERHWFTDSLKFKVDRLPRNPIRQPKSMIGQMSLPGMMGEADRNLPVKVKRVKKKRGAA